MEGIRNHIDRNQRVVAVALLALVVLGIVLRLWLTGVTAIDPRFSNADDGDYYRRALRVAVTGQYLDDAWLIRPPLHVFFFALWIKLALLVGQAQYDVLFVQFAQIGLSALLIMVGYDSARRLFRSRTAGLLFAGFLAAWFPFVEMPTVLFSELLYLVLFLLHFWLLLRFDTNRRWYELALAGLVLGMAALTRSPALYSLAFVAVWLLVRARSSRLAAGGSQPSLVVEPALSLPKGRWSFAAGRWALPLAQALLIASCTVAVVAPWTLRNYLLYQRFIPVDTLGPINLWLDLDRVDRRDRNIDTLRGLPQADRQAYATTKVREILAEDPLRPLRGMGESFRHVWKAQYIEDYYVKQSLFSRPLREAAPLGLFGDLLWVGFTLAGLIGLAGPVREGWHNRLFVLAWLGYSLLTVLIFHVEPRYLLPIWTLIGLYGAGTLARLIRSGKPAASDNSKHVCTTTSAKSTKAFLQLPAYLGVYVIPLLIAMTFLILLVSYRDYPALIARGVAREAAIGAGDRAYAASQYRQAEGHYRAALAAHPEFVDAQVSLALALAAQGQRQQAEELVASEASRRARAVLGGLWRDAGDDARARDRLTRVENNAGEDIQVWAIRWLRPRPVAALAIGNGLDLGYIRGFSRAEGSPPGQFRWLEGTGEVLLPLAEPLAAGSELLLRMTGGAGTATPLEVQIGNGPPQRLEVLHGQWRSYRLALPAELVGQRQIAIQLRAPTFIPMQRDAASDDARALSLMVSEVSIR